MNDILQGTVLEQCAKLPGADIYNLKSDKYVNNYYVVSSGSSTKLMSSPEVVGFYSYQCMLAPTIATFKYFKEQGLDGKFDILTILRGGLNYPLEEACYTAGIQVGNMNFISCERKIENGVITGLDIKYEKLHIAKDVSLLIGDIVASGDTLRLCLWQIIDRFRRKGGSIRRIIFFTIGGTKAITLMEGLTTMIREIWPEFEGFTCVFYEGIFTVYTEKGVTGVNIPDIDFGWKGGAVSPDFRRFVFRFNEYALFEKCIIYDGGARRYEIPEHIEEVTEYWEDILRVAPQTDMKAFVAEKIGYEGTPSYEDWLEILHYRNNATNRSLYDLEMNFVRRSADLKLEDVARTRLAQFGKSLEKYKAGKA